METLVAVEQRARELGQSAAQVLLANGILTQDQYYFLVAKDLGLPFCETVPPGGRALTQLPLPGDWLRMARLSSRSSLCVKTRLNLQPPRYFLAPDEQQLVGLRALLRRNPHFRQRLSITSHASGFHHLIGRGSDALLEQAKNNLSRNQPHLSAVQVLSVRQAVIIMLVLQVQLVSFIDSSEIVLVALHLPALLAYLCQAGLRFFAWVAPPPLHPDRDETRRADAELPVYSILVALYDEANQADGLIAALAKLDWPRERIEIMLICEADDQATLAAVKGALARKGLPNASIVAVPPGQPRTKPKALNYALPLCSGEFLVVYDAEDRPHPGQLREAYQGFRRGAANLACLQSPLSIENHADGFLPRMFAIEYSAHFDGLLPLLAKLDLPIPLGGSSNHFKRQTLIQIGAWDPYNVTEDADLGMRFSRAGCIIGTLELPTFEEAPTTWQSWLRQRTRWFKGFYQTWLVHMRHPLILFCDLGLYRFLAFQLLTLGAAAAALLHPFLIAFLSITILEILRGVAPVWKYLLVGADLFAVFFSVGAFCLLAARTLPRRNLGGLRRSLWQVPLYWNLLSVAAWRALVQLCLRPHHWEKTPHGLSVRGRGKTPDQPSPT